MRVAGRLRDISVIIRGKHVPNTTCGRCRFRHPPGITCEAARKIAEHARNLRDPDIDLSRAFDACDRFDAEVFSGDAFIDPGAVSMLSEYLDRWRRACLERDPTLEEHRADPDLVHRRLGTLVALLRSGKIIRGGLTPQEMADWAKQCENIMAAPKAAPPEKDPLLL
jgi:hypothetical protein